mgnify:CR=1 FL=1
MLVVTRKRGERILIGRNCWMKIIDIKGGHVRLGFDAPPSVQVLREEIAGHEVLSMSAVERTPVAKRLPPRNGGKWPHRMNRAG